MDTLWGVGFGCVVWHLLIIGVAFSAGRGWLRSPIAIERQPRQGGIPDDPYSK